MTEGGVRMKVIWKAVCAAVLLIAATSIEVGCGDTYRPVATPLPPVGGSGNPAGNETEAVLSCCLNPSSINAVTATPSSVLTDIDVSGNSNAGNKVLGSIVGNGTVAVAAAQNPMAFDGTRSSVFTANTSTDSVTQSLLNVSAGGFSASTNTISLEPGSHPVAVSFQYFGATYTQDYVLNSGANATCPGTGSVGVIAEAASLLKATVCIGSAATPSNPVSAWIFRDQSKVFVMDNVAPGTASVNGNIYVVSASKYKVTNSFQVGKNPVKFAQSADGNYIYTLNSGDGTISIIDAVAEQVVKSITVSNTLSNPLIDIAQDPNFTDTSANTQYNHIWVLQADGTVSVYDNSSPGSLTPVTSLATGPNPTNLALMRDGTMAYVGLGGTDKMVAIDTSKLATGGAPTLNATTTITVGVHRTATFEPYVLTPPCTTPTTGCPPVTTFSGFLSEVTTPVVTYVAVSRQSSTATGDSADLAKAYAITTTLTKYTYFDANQNPLDPHTIPTWTLPSTCSLPTGITNEIDCPNLYSGTAVVAGASNGTTLVNTYITTVPAPSQVTYCNPETTLPDGPKACPLMTPTVLLGRS